MVLIYQILFFVLCTAKKEKEEDRGNRHADSVILAEKDEEIKGQTRNRHACCVIFAHIITYNGASVWSSWLCLRPDADLAGFAID